MLQQTALYIISLSFNQQGISIGQIHTQWNSKSKDIHKDLDVYWQISLAAFPLTTITSHHTVPNRRVYCSVWSWFALWAIHTHLYAHTPSILISVLSGNYSDACLLLVIVQRKEKVNWGVWVIDWKQGVICQSSHWPEISATVQTHMPHHRFSVHVLFWKHKDLLIAFSN